MPDLITGPIDPAAGLAARGASVATPSSMFSGIDPFETSEQLIRQGGYNAARFGFVDPETHLQLTEPEPNASPEELKQYEVPDSPDMKGLHFTSPLPASVAQSMHDAKQEEIMRASVAGNQPGGFANTVGRTAVSFAAGMLDPVNIAASLIPVAGEARMGAALLRTLGDEVGGRLATNFATGAARGAVGQVPLVAARYGMSQQEQADYTASNAMADLVMGTLLGGGLHTVVEGAHDWLGGRFRRTPEAAIVEASPAAREATMNAAVAAVAEDRPVDVASYIRLQEPMPVVDQRMLSLAAEEANLRAQDETLSSARADVPATATEAEVTLARLEAIDGQLRGDVEPAQRRALQERKDELLGSTTPEELQAQAQPAREFRQAENQRDAIQARLSEIATERTRIAADAKLGPQYVAGDLAAAWRERTQNAARDVAGSETVRRAAGAPDPETVRLGQQADAAAKVKPPETPEMPPEPDAEAMAARMQAAKALLDQVKKDTETEIKVPNRAPDFAGGNADVYRDGATVLRVHRNQNTFTPRPISDRVLQPTETSEGGRIEQLPFVEGAAPLSKFTKAEVREFMQALRRDGLAVSDVRNDNFAIVDGKLKAIDPGAVSEIRDSATDGRIGKHQYETAKQYGVDLSEGRGIVRRDYSPAEMLTQGERDELKAMDEAHANSEGEAKAYEAAAQCFMQGLI